MERGSSLVELIVGVAILGVTAVIVVPAMLSLSSRAALKGATSRVETLMRLTREEAVSSGVNRAIRFEWRQSTWFVTTYEDGDGDGVQLADIGAGIDRPMRGPEILLVSSAAEPGIIRGGFHDPDGDWIDDGSSPVRFGTARLCSFAPDGSSTPGTLYLRSGVRAAAVRASGASGRVHVLYYGGVTWTDAM